MKKKSKKSGKKFVDRNEIFLPLPRRTMSARCAPRARSIFYQAGERIATCPARKNGQRKEDEKVKKYQSKKGKKNLQANV
jgi:hypothetical protein